MKHIKLFEQFISERAMSPNNESDVKVDAITLEDGRVIKAAEILGMIVDAETEKEIEDYFYTEYGQTAFKGGELDKIKELFNEYQAEQKEAEAEDKKDEEGGGEEDPLAGLGV